MSEKMELAEQERPFWVVERYINGQLCYWSPGARGRSSRDEWSASIDFAIRLADHDSSQIALVHTCGGEGRAVLHQYLRASSPAQETRFDSVAQRIERSEPDEGRRDAGSNPVAIDPAQEPVTTEPVALDHTAAAKAAEAIFDYTDNNLTMFDATDCPSEKAQQLYETAKILRDMFQGIWPVIPAPPQPGRKAIIEECAKVAESFRRQMLPGDDRILIRKIEDAIRALKGEPK